MSPRGTTRNEASAAQPTAPSATCRSVGKLPASLTTSVREGSRWSAATISLNRLAEVESPTITSSAAAPISGAIWAPSRCGASIQPSFQLRISRSPHWRPAASANAAGVATGSAPSELPSR